MKTYKTYIRAILPLLVVLGLVGSAQAQNSASTAMTGSATIVDAIGITQQAQLDFGQVLSTTTNTVDLDANPSGTNNEVGANAAQGQFGVTGSEGATVLLGFSATEIELSGTNTPANKMYWEPEIWDGSAYVADGGTFTLTSNAASSPGDILYVGGLLYQNSATPAALDGNVDADTYTGTFTLTVSYN